MNLLEVDATSYDDYTSVGNKFIAILRMAERNKILENRTSKISTLDIDNAIKEKDSIVSDDDEEHLEEYNINYLIAYISLYCKVVSNYEVLFQEQDTTKFNEFYDKLNNLGLNLKDEFEFEDNYSIFMEKNPPDYKKLQDLPFINLNKILEMLLQRKPKDVIDNEIKKYTNGGGMKGGAVALFAAKPIAAIYHRIRVKLLRPKVLDMLKYLYLFDDNIHDDFSKLEKNKIIKLTDNEHINILNFLKKIFNAELINIFRMSFFSLLRTRGIGLNKIGNMILKCGICKSRIVYFVLCHNKNTNTNTYESTYLVFMYLRPKGIKQIYIYRFDLENLNINTNNCLPSIIGGYMLKKKPLDNHDPPDEVGIREKVKEFFKKNLNTCMCYDIDYLIAKIDYAIKCETHTLYAKKMYKNIDARIITFHKIKRSEVRTRRRRKDMEKFFTGTQSNIQLTDYNLYKGAPEMVYLHDIIKNGLQINIDRPAEDLIRIIQDKEDEEIVDTERQELQTRRRVINLVRDSDITTAMEGKWVGETNSGGGRKITKKNINKIKNKKTNKIYSKKVRLN